MRHGRRGRWTLRTHVDRGSSMFQPQLSPCKINSLQGTQRSATPTLMDGAFLFPRLPVRAAGLSGRRRQITMPATQTPIVALRRLQLARPLGKTAWLSFRNRQEWADIGPAKGAPRPTTVLTQMVRTHTQYRPKAGGGRSASLHMRTEKPPSSA